MKTRPRALPVLAHGIPELLKEEATRFLIWRYTLVKGRNGWQKVPLDPRNGRAMGATNPDRGTSFEVAFAAMKKYRADGIGFILGRGIAGFDFDDCIDGDGNFTKQGAKYSDMLAKTFAEISPSGTGFHALLRIDPNVHVIGRRSNGVEAYAEKRYFCMTGHHIDGHATTVTKSTSLFEKVMAAAKIALTKPKKEDPPVDDFVAPLDAEERATLEDIDRVRRALTKVSADDYETWVMVGAAMRHAFRHDEELEQKAIRVWVRWSQSTSRDNFAGEEGCLAKWNKLDTGDSTNKAGLGAIFHLAGTDGRTHEEQEQDAKKHEQEAKARGVGRSHILTWAEDGLIDARTYVDNILTAGLTLMIGSPKFGKTFLALQLLAALKHKGGLFLGHVVEAQVRVCMLALEEGEEFTEDNDKRIHPSQRIARRLQRMGYTPADVDHASFIFEIAPYSNGGLAFIEKQLAKCDVLIIDSLAVLRSGSKDRKDATAWGREYEFVQALQRVASKAGKAILVLAHSGKGANAKDPLDAIAGTQGLQAAADGMFVLQTPDQLSPSRIRFTALGREIPRNSFELAFNKETLQFDYLGEWVNLSPRMQEALDALMQRPYGEREALRYEELSLMTGMPADQLRKYMQTLVAGKLVETVRLPSERRGRPFIALRATDMAYRRAGRIKEIEASEQRVKDMLK